MRGGGAADLDWVPAFMREQSPHFWQAVAILADRPMQAQWRG